MQSQHPHSEQPGDDRDAVDAMADAIDASEASLSEHIANLETELTQLRDDRLRERAELENQRRRLARDLDMARKFANERLLGDLLPVFDALEQGLAAAGDNANLRAGIELTLKQLLKVATDNGLSVLDPTGQAFDPESHQAMSMVPADGCAPNTVVQVFQKGYRLHERLLRPAMVVVSSDG